MGCDGRIFLFEDLIYNFQMIGKTTLNLMSNPATTPIWAQGWWNVNDLNMIGDWAIEWNNFTKSLQRVHVRLSDSEDELVWRRNVVGGNCSTKLGYDALFGPRENDEVWWWKKIWKVKGPPKSILFMWIYINNKVLTWEMLRKRNREGPGICLLCHNSEETTTGHLVGS
jgi:hypothetical protein